MTVKVLFTLIFLLLTGLLWGQNGTVKTYYPSGKIASRLSFIKDVLEGGSYWYFENGNIKILKEYSNGRLNGSVKNFYPNGLVKDEKNFLDGLLHGVAKTYYDNGGLKQVKTYNYGELTNNNIVDYDSNYIAPLSLYDAGKEVKRHDDNDFICGVEICPEPVGGIKEIEDRIVYPFLARQFKLEGAVLLTATINERGIAENIRVNQGLGLGCDEAAIEAVRNTKFIPGMSDGETVETDVTFKLNFRIREASHYLKAASEVYQSDTVNIYPVKSDFIICDTEVCPKPSGGIIKLLSILRYPPQAKRKKIEGDVIIEAIINEIGFVTSAEILKGIGYGCDQEAKSAIIKTQFEPGRKDGKDVESIIEIAVPFILDEKINKTKE